RFGKAGGREPIHLQRVRPDLSRNVLGQARGVDDRDRLRKRQLTGARQRVDGELPAVRRDQVSCHDAGQRDAQVAIVEADALLDDGGPILPECSKEEEADAGQDRGRGDELGRVFRAAHESSRATWYRPRGFALTSLSWCRLSARSSCGPCRRCLDEGSNMNTSSPASTARFIDAAVGLGSSTVPTRQCAQRILSCALLYTIAWLGTLRSNCRIVPVASRSNARKATSENCWRTTSS